jgi:hypothetical protein
LPTHVYAAGFERIDSGLELAMLWKDGTSAILGQPANGSRATSVAVSGPNVYVSGVEGNGTQDVAKYWRNGVPVELTDGTQRGFATSIYISGTDIYVAGGEQPALGNIVPKYWKNGVPVVLPDSGQGALAQSIFVSGNNVYVAGWQNKTTQIDPTHTLTRPAATYWKNGIATELAAGTAGSMSNCIFVVGTDIYVTGCLSVLRSRLCTCDVLEKRRSGATHKHY